VKPTSKAAFAPLPCSNSRTGQHFQQRRRQQVRELSHLNLLEDEHGSGNPS